MAYAAVISLKQTLHRVLHPSHISTPQIFQAAYNQVISLQQMLKRLDDCSSELLNALGGKIKHEAHKLEDLLESHQLNHFLEHSESYADLDEVTQGFNSFCEKAEKIRKDCFAQIGHLSNEEEEYDDDNNEAVPSDQIIEADPFDHTEIKYRLTEGMRPDDFGVFQVTGLPGSGATIAAITVLEDLKHCFDCHVAVRVGSKYERKELLLEVVAQIDEHDESLNGKGDEEIGRYLYACLRGRRYLIVFDDVHEETWNFLERFLPVQDNGSAVLITTRGTQNDFFPIRNSFLHIDLATRSQESWWYLFYTAVFGLMPCPPELVESGKKIVRNCKSLGVQVLKVILLLLKAEKTPEYWNKLAEDEENPIFVVDDEVHEVFKIKEELFSANYSFLDGVEKGLLLELIDFSKSCDVIKMEMFPKMFFPRMVTISLLGMAGIGKTSLVKEIFKDQSIRCHFDDHVWLALGPEYKFDEILVDLLAQIHPNIDKKQIKGDEDLVKSLCAQLLGKKCLIVLDDVWSTKSLHYIKRLFPDIKGAILVTTRLSNVAEVGQRDIVCKMRLLSKEESWDLFCDHLFGEEKCPLHLEKAGKKIVENCEGLPLMIVKVAHLLSNTEKTLENWSVVAQRNSQIFMDAYDQISNILVPSYDHLPQYLKVCFLYIGIFTQNKVIPTSKLFILWISEGFLEPNPSQTKEDYAAECLMELENRSLLMASSKSSNFRIKTCSLHSVFWHLSNNVAKEDKFFHAFTTLDDSTTEDMESQRRLCIRNSTLLGFKYVHDSIASISGTRSLLCTGLYHQYPVPLYFGFELLRVMDALVIRLYEFPIQVVKSYYLRYLAVTYNGNLPSSVSKLRNLQFLIVSRHLNIISSKDSSYLPMEIWDMHELKHLRVGRSNLPNPKRGIVLPNLLTLLDVSARSCTKKVLKGVPNLKRLGIQIELEPDEKRNPFRRLNHISGLQGLESLKCVVVNPEFLSKVVPPPVPRSMFPSGLKKLSLSGLGYPWEYMKIISQLENLEVLKLRCYAFQGPEWEMDYDDLFSVRFLLIEDTDLVRWKFTTASFIHLKCLVIRHCYQLEELPRDLSNSVETIEVVDCNPFVVDWAKKLEEHVINFKVISSWDVKNVEGS